MKKQEPLVQRINVKKEPQIVPKHIWKEREALKEDETKSLIVQIALKAQKKLAPWILDSGCSSHMTGDKQKFTKIQDYDGGSVKFGNNDGAQIVGRGIVSISDNKIRSEDVLYVEGLKHNLLSVSQICDRGHEVIFKKQGCKVRKAKNGRIVVVGSRTSRNLYTLENDTDRTCMMGQVEKNWLWHRRLGHISFDNLVKISSKNAVRDIPKKKKPKNGICDSCQKGKQACAHFKTKEHHTSKPLELIHTDLCEPMRT